MQKVTVVIAGRKYPLKVTSEEQKLIAGVEKMLNDELIKFQSSYPTRDIQDGLAVLLLKLAIEKPQNIDPMISEKLSQIEHVLESS